MLARFNGNVVPFADDATSTNRTVFGGTTQSDNIDDNLNADFKKGWEIVGLNDNPTREDFNAMGYTLGALTAYLYEMGIAEWNASQNYRINSRVIGSNGKIYKALTGTIGTPNVNHNPTSDAVNWEWELKTITDYSALTSKTTPVDADLLALGDSASSFSLKKLTWANLKTVLFGSPALTGTPTAPTPTVGDNSTKVATTAFVANLNSANVKLTGDQTIAGVKTFSSSPIVPTPTTGTQAVNKDYVDARLPVGAILNGYTIFNNCIVAFGGEFNRADYPKLWAYLQSNPSLVKTQAQWTTESTANGGICGFYSEGNGTTTFRVPNLDKSFLRPDSRGVGSYQADEFKSHSHGLPGNTSNGTTDGSADWNTGSTTSAYYNTRTAGDTETRPKNIAVLPLIVAN